MASILERFKSKPIKQKSVAERHEDALYREINEEVHAEKTLMFVKKYARPLIAFAIILVIGVVGFQTYNYFNNRAQLNIALQYESAINNQDVAALQELFRKHKSATGDLAMFQSYQFSGDKNALYELLKNGKSRDFRDLARIYIVSLDGDEMSESDVREMLEPTFVKQSPFYYSGLLLMAQKYIASNDIINGNTFLDKILSDSSAPQSITAQAQLLK